MNQESNFKAVFSPASVDRLSTTFSIKAMHTKEIILEYVSKICPQRFPGLPIGMYTPKFAEMIMAICSEENAGARLSLRGLNRFYGLMCETIRITPRRLPRASLILDSLVAVHFEKAIFAGKETPTKSALYASFGEALNDYLAEAQHVR